MKKLFLLIVVLFATISYSSNAQNGNGDGKSPATDQSMVLQKCIDLPELQQYYPMDADGNFKPIYIMQHSINFPDNLNLDGFSKKIVFMTKDQIYKNNVDAFFQFEKFDILQNSANITFTYFYDLNIKSLIKQIVPIELLKAGDSWNELTIKLERKQLL